MNHIKVSLIEINKINKIYSPVVISASMVFTKALFPPCFSVISGLFESATPYKNQKYSHLKKECISAGKLFEDPVFPTVASSLSYTGYAPRDIVWKRPGVGL